MTRVIESSLEVGDRVLVRNVRLRGKHKLADKWDSEVYVVVNRAGDLPVYTVKPEGKERPLQTLHRDLLLPCGFLSTYAEEQKLALKPQRGRAVPGKVHQEEYESSEQCLDFDGEDSDYLVQEFEPIYETSPVRFVKEYEVMRAQRDVPLRDVEPVIQMLPDSNPARGNVVDSTHDKCLPEPGYSPETQSSSGLSSVHSELMPERRKLEERSRMSETRQQVEGDREDPVEYEAPEEDTESDECEAGSRLRKSKRVRQKSKRLTYPQLGSPMISIIQSLLQGLNTAFIETLAEQPRSVKRPNIE